MPHPPRNSAGGVVVNHLQGLTLQLALQDQVGCRQQQQQRRSLQQQTGREAMSAATALGPQAVVQGMAQAVPLANVGVVAAMAAVISSSSQSSQHQQQWYQQQWYQQQGYQRQWGQVQFQ